MTNRIASIVSKGRIAFAEREVGELMPGQALVRIRASAICGSDLHLFKDRHPAVRLPVTVGHEFSGDVVAVGPGVDSVRPGDRVTVEPVIACGKCPACRRGQYGYCEAISFTYRQGDGAMAEYFVGDAQRMFRLPEDLGYEAAALTEPMAVALHAVKRAGVGLDDRVAVIGAGAIGIFIAAISRHLGARDVVISDVSRFRLARALEMGATRAVLAGAEDVDRVALEMSGGRGFDLSFECVGREATLVQAIRSVKQNGLVTNVGIFEEPEVRLDISVLVRKELRLQGSQGYCWDFEQAITLVKALGADRLITHEFGLDEIEKAFEAALDPAQNALKVIVKPGRDGGDPHGGI